MTPPRRAPLAVRAVRTVWALPGTVLGIVLGLASRARPRVDEGTIVFEGRRGFTVLLERVGYRAITLGQVIVVHGALSERLRRHEREHVSQWETGGPIFAVLYHLEGLRQLLWGRRYYRDNWFERQARLAERGTTAAGTAEREPVR